MIICSCPTSPRVVRYFVIFSFILSPLSFELISMFWKVYNIFLSSFYYVVIVCACKYLCWFINDSVFSIHLSFSEDLPQINWIRLQLWNNTYSLTEINWICCWIILIKYIRFLVYLTLIDTMGKRFSLFSQQFRYREIGFDSFGYRFSYLIYRKLLYMYTT